MVQLPYTARPHGASPQRDFAQLDSTHWKSDNDVVSPIALDLPSQLPLLGQILASPPPPKAFFPAPAILPDKTRFALITQTDPLKTTKFHCLNILRERPLQAQQGCARGIPSLICQRCLTLDAAPNICPPLERPPLQTLHPHRHAG